MDAPLRINNDSDQQALTVSWKDGHQGLLPFRHLRMACQCARCVHEITGELLIQSDAIPADIHAVELSLTGNYALKVRWSDGHDTGLFTWDRMRQLCQCPDCLDAE